MTAGVSKKTVIAGIGAAIGALLSAVAIVVWLSILEHHGYRLDVVRESSVSIVDANSRWDGDTFAAHLILLEAAKNNYCEIVSGIPEIQDVSITVPFVDEPRLIELDRTASIVLTLKEGMTLSPDTSAFVARLAMTAFGISNPRNLVITDHQMRRIWPVTK